MITMTATYDPADNKLRLRASSRLVADTYARVRAAGFIWAPKQDLFVAPMWTPARADLLEEMCGDIGDEDTSLVERAEERAERFDVYSEKRADDAERARDAVSAIADNIPFGQPILVGHHSERHARKDAQRIENGMRKAVKMWETSNYWTARAAGALRHAKYKERPDVRHRRIKGLESDLRREQKRAKIVSAFTRLWSVPGLTLEAAKQIANHDHVTVLQADGNYRDLWSLLTYEGLSPADAAAHAMKAHSRTVANSERWIAHINNRLDYERAMLGESGWTPPPKPKTKADLPLLNYSGEVAYRNPWRSGEIVRAEAVGITKAEYAKIYTDYKGTRVSECGTHRVRTAILGAGNSRGLTIVYLTDSKQHPRPGADVVQAKAEAEEVAADKAIAARLAKAEERAARPAPEVDPREAEFGAIKQSLRGGVQVVTANQLFPTPADVASRMVELAEVPQGGRVLEPSAGTRGDPRCHRARHRSARRDGG